MGKNKQAVVGLAPGRFDWFTEIDIKLLDGGRKPKRSDSQAIGFDLFVPKDFLVPAHSRCVVPLAFCLGLPPNIEAKIEPRSGYSAKGMEGLGAKAEPCKLLGIIPWKKDVYGMHRFNADVLVGKIDPGYKDSVGVIIRNDDNAFILRKGTRIAQMTFYRVVSPRSFRQVETLSGTDRGGGFGHSNEI